MQTAAFKIDGVYCRLVPLTRGYWAIVDAADYAALSASKWQALDIDGHVVAARTVQRDGVKTTIYMHHALLPKREGFEVDHANRSPLDNRRKNLRYATRLQNQRNKGVTAGNSSGFKGVSRHGQTGKWRATIRLDGKLLSLGLFREPQDAALAYDSAARQHFGEFACLNFN